MGSKDEPQGRAQVSEGEEGIAPRAAPPGLGRLQRLWGAACH